MVVAGESGNLNARPRRSSISLRIGVVVGFFFLPERGVVEFFRNLSHYRRGARFVTTAYTGEERKKNVFTKKKKTNKQNKRDDGRPDAVLLLNGPRQIQRRR